MASRTSDPRGRRSPPSPLLPALGAASFSTAPDLCRLRQLVARLSPQAASKRGLSARAKAEAAAAKEEEKAASQRDMLAEHVRLAPHVPSAFAHSAARGSAPVWMHYTGVLPHLIMRVRWLHGSEASMVAAPQQQHPGGASACVLGVLPARMCLKVLAQRQ